MYALPDGVLSYIFISSSIVHCVMAGLFLVPFWGLALLFLFRLWQDDVWEEHYDWIMLLYKAGFSCTQRSLLPQWCFVRGEEKIIVTSSPLCDWTCIIQEQSKSYRLLSERSCEEIIDSLAREESTSSPQSF